MERKDQGLLEDQHKYLVIQDQLNALKEKFDSDRIALISQQFPEIVHDAERFLDSVHKSRGAFYTPWEYFNVDDASNTAEEIQDTYDVRWQRQRPGREHTSARTDLFYEVSEILFERKMVELRKTKQEGQG